MQVYMLPSFQAPLGLESGVENVWRYLGTWGDFRLSLELVLVFN